MLIVKLEIGVHQGLGFRVQDLGFRIQDLGNFRGGKEKCENGKDGTMV